MSNYSKIDSCRISNSEELVNILDLGFQPLANAYQESSNSSTVNLYPLNLLFNKVSRLVQIEETVDKRTLFNQYNWVTGTAESTRRYADQFFSRVTDKIRVQRHDFVIEVASNDGYLLNYFKDYKNLVFPEQN